MRSPESEDFAIENDKTSARIMSFSDGTVMIELVDDWGPVVYAENREEAIEAFEKALNSAMFLKNILYVDKVLKGHTISDTILEVTPQIIGGLDRELDLNEC